MATPHPETSTLLALTSCGLPRRIAGLVLRSQALAARRSGIFIAAFVAAFEARRRFVRALTDDLARAVSLLVIIAILGCVFGVALPDITGAAERLPDFSSGVTGAAGPFCATSATIGVAIFGETSLWRFAQIHPALRTAQIHACFGVCSNDWFHTTSSGREDTPIVRISQMTIRDGMERLRSAPKLARVPRVKKKVLFVCIHNSARSQMAEAFLNDACPDQFLAQSAGIEPGKLNPTVVQAMQETGIDISQNKTKAVADFIQRGEQFDYVVTVCDETSAERCPVFPGQTKRLHWGFPDPSSFAGTPEEKLARTREVRDTIKARINAWCDEMCGFGVC